MKTAPKAVEKKKKKSSKSKKKRSVEQSIEDILHPENAEAVAVEDQMSNEEIQVKMKKEQNVIGDNLSILDNLLGKKGVQEAGKKSDDLPNFGNLFRSMNKSGGSSKVQDNVSLINSLIKGKLNQANTRKFNKPVIPKAQIATKRQQRVSRPKPVQQMAQPRRQPAQAVAPTRAQPAQQTKQVQQSSLHSSRPTQQEINAAKPELRMTIDEFQNKIGQGEIGRGPGRANQSQRSMSPQIQGGDFQFPSNSSPGFGQSMGGGQGAGRRNDPTQIPLFGEHLVRKNTRKPQSVQQAPRPAPPKQKSNSFDFGSGGGFSDFNSFDLDNFIDKPQNDAQKRLDPKDNLTLKGKVPALNDFPTFQEFLKNGALPKIPGIDLPLSLKDIKGSDKSEEELSKELGKQIKIAKLDKKKKKVSV